jgi:hypothetical protein
MDQEDDQERYARTLFRNLLDMPLYVPLKLSKTAPNMQLRQLFTYSPNLDAYCPECGKHTTWKAVPRSSGGGAGMRPRTEFMGPFALDMQCSRNAAHRPIYYFTTDPVKTPVLSEEFSDFDVSITKVGQSPSLTDFQKGDLSGFDDAMSKEQRTEFVRAINCAAHGFSVAACVYYRRVFESVLVESRDAHMKSAGMTEWPEFRAARTDERIKLLKDELPAFLSEHPHLYGILSLGVHELSEAECAAELPMLRQAIQLIFEDRKIEMQKRKTREAVSKMISQSAGKLGNRES